MTDLTDEDKKRLTEFVGECWHTHKGDGSIQCSCGYIPYYPNRDAGRDPLRLIFHFKEMNNRPFTTGNDMVAVKDKLVERGLWEDFHIYCTQRCDRMLRPHEFENWLFTPTRFCKLASEWLKEKEK